MIKLGVKAREKVTGFEGIITARGQYLTGCDQYLLVPGLTEKGQPGESHWFDENRLEVIGEGVELTPVYADGGKPAVVTGGPQEKTPPSK